MDQSPDSPGARFRRALEDTPLLIPGVFNALSTRMAERAGFRAVYQSGAALSAGLAAVPDIGLISQTEFADQARYLTEAVTIPVISDADTGFGEPIVVERTVQSYEAAGLAGLHLEDQQLPKRCGHLSGKTLVSTDDMVAKIKAAVTARRDSAFVIIARTDARSVESLEGALERATAYVEAGADMVFPEALQTAEEFAEFAAGATVPLMANMTEFGKSPLLTADELGTLGYAAVLFPVTLLRVAMRAVQESLSEIAEQGTQRRLIDRMLTRGELYDLIGYKEYDQRDQEYFGG
jgi:methylisocitrate lyase